MLAAYSMYVLGIATAIGAALVMHLFTRKKEINTLLIELPEYKSPKHGNKRPPGQPNLPHDPIHHIGNPCHITAVLQKCKGQKQYICLPGRRRLIRC